ncbi:hypothetical protein B0J11DRAFT_215718 [Dendryphion nanum]|uniref:Arrestin C-terminal-like domain-containing protein n=1 Tax=Dendryphion nanum TaxID=256645 RepID=A0A9P9E787_9PLEO|nr:hypothetical protein B0J11DRAFT_215718 [Dendryphion nanum]
MTPSPARDITKSSSLSGRSLFARLKSPLQSKTRNFADFYIQPDDPHRQYAPGDIISGSVIIKVLKPLRITHLVISLHGYAQVFKNPNSPGDGYRNYSSTVGSGKGKKGGSYFGNGFASLFEDEAVLCGEGRLGEGVYHFNFELEFPTKGLPSSIDFERGTITYMLTSTLTRPTPMSPTTTCDSKVYLQDTIDIAPIQEPKPRVISLEPISRRARPKTSVRKRPTTISETSQQGKTSSEPTQSGRVSELNSVTEESDGPGSPGASEGSFESQLSSGNASGTEYGIRSVNTTLEGGGSPNGSRKGVKDKTITATIDVLKGGFLRGDHIPIKITVNHTKHVRSLKGIIITLYRQARVDMHPALPVLPNSKGDKMKSEDYYPKSKTGLGGLSLASAGSSHLFRKDLSQAFAPLFVDPRTLTAEVKCAVRVPDEAFPTISNVPGAMISFKYFVEVVVDIQGKLTGLDRMIPNAGLPSMPAAGSMRTDDANKGMFSTWGGNFVDTDGLRREKGIVSSLFEVIIGTKDSERNGKRKQQLSGSQLNSQPGVHDITYGSNDGPDATGGPAPDPNSYDYDGQYYDHYAYDDAYNNGGYYNNPPYSETNNSQPPYQHLPPQSVPPTADNEEGLTEKERLRRAEARLLPSQPPNTGGSSSTPGPPPNGMPASAPMLPEDDELYAPYYQPEASSSHPPPFQASQPISQSHAPPPIQRRDTDDDTRTTTTGSSLTINANARQAPVPSVNGTVPDSGTANSGLPLPPSSPAPEYSPSSSAHVQPTDDKNELQRRRLKLERSAPPGTLSEGDYQDAGPSAPPISDMQTLTLAPSAPILEEEDEDLVESIIRPSGSAQREARPMSEALPVYQR